MTTLEIILISYILLIWFLMIMFVLLPRKVTNKLSFIFIIICPPLIIVFISEGITRTLNEKKKEKANE
jgi:uncharacterized membrane protein